MKEKEIEKIKTISKLFDEKLEKYTTKKAYSLEIASIVKKFNVLRGQRIMDCGTYLEFELGTVTGQSRLSNANFCRDRLCIMCQWRASMKAYSTMKKMTKYIESNIECNYLLLTLTVPNCSGKDLKCTIDKLFKSFNKLTRKKEFKKLSLGFYRKLEVTYNKDTDTYHPHLHSVLVVSKSYYTNKNIYLKKDKWIRLWKECNNSDVNLSIDIRPIDIVSNSNAVSEVTKYTFKSKDILTDDEQKNIEILQYLASGLAYKRIVGYGGIFKEAKKIVGDTDDFYNINSDGTVSLEEDYIRCVFLYQSSGVYELYKI